MTEADLNNSIMNSLGWGYKIPDPPQAAARFSAKRPFDGFGVMVSRIEGQVGVPVYWEAKLLKGYQALPFDRVAPHQAKALLELKALGGDTIETLILVGIHMPYHGIHLFSFDISCFLMLEQRGLSKSITKAQFEALQQQNRYLTSHKERFNFTEELLVKTITMENCPL